MTNKKIAIITPRLGVISETFIRRHIEDLHPQNTVVITRSYDKSVGHWTVNCPTLFLEQLYPNPLELLTTYADKNKQGKIKGAFYRHRKGAVKRFLKKHQVRVILGEYLDFSYYFISIAHELGIPFWGHALGYDVSRQLQNPQWRKNYQAYNNTAGIISVNKGSKIRFVDLGIHSDKIHVVPCGANVPDLRPNNNNSESGTGRIRCFAVGRMVAKKAPILLLDAFRRAVKQNPQLHLDYVGYGALMPAVKQFIHAFELKQHVTLHNAVENKEVHRIMLNTDIFLQHSIVDPDSFDEEGLPVVILEAMAHGVPVVSTRHAGIPEAVIEGKTGLLVDEGDTKGMAEQILTLANNSELRKELGFAGLQRVKDYFSWEVERNKLLRILELPE
jgi:glycosyltransferase involved in cell wall biosynthesis